jgi:hypothetical protein
MVRRTEKESGAGPRMHAEWIDDLLRRYGDVPLVQQEAEALRRRREELRKQIELDDAALIEKAFGPTEMRMRELDHVELRWVFNSRYEGPFQRGDWNADVEGWIAPAARSRDQVASTRDWPTLYLKEPLELGEALSFELVLEQPESSGEPRLLALSVAGVHAVFLGATAPGGKGRLGIGAGTPEDFAELLHELIDLDRGAEIEPLQRGRRATIGLQLRQGRGAVTVTVDGLEVGRGATRRPAATHDKSIVVRSLEPVRILEARLIAKH